jgi:outer membrane protein
MSVPGSLQEAASKAADERPDLAAMAFHTRAAKRQLAAKSMEWLPSVDGNFTYLYTQNSGFIGEEWQWRLSLQARWTLWDGGLRLAQGRELTSRLRQARLVERRQAQIATEEVRVAWESYVRAERALHSVETEVALAKRNRELAERGFGAGSVTWLEVEQAELALQGATLARITERMNLDLAAIDLNIAVGTM